MIQPRRGWPFWFVLAMCVVAMGMLTALTWPRPLVQGQLLTGWVPESCNPAAITTKCRLIINATVRATDLRGHVYVLDGPTIEFISGASKDMAFPP